MTKINRSKMFKTTPWLALIVIVGLSSIDTKSYTNWRTKLESDVHWNPNETYTMIRELMETHRSDSDSNPVIQKQIDANYAKLVALASLHDLDESNCSEADWIKFLNLLEEFQFDTVNIVKYMEWTQKNQAKRCKAILGSNNPFKANAFDWVEYENKLFDKRGSPIGTPKMMELMQNLRGLYESRKDIGSKSRLRRLNGLMSLSEMTPSRCNSRSVDEMVKYYTYYDNMKNIVPYIMESNERLLKYCNSIGKPIRDDSNDPENLYKLIISAKARLPLGVRGTLEKMKQFVEQSKSGLTSQTQARRLQKIRNLIEWSNLDDKNCNNEGWQRMANEFERYRYHSRNIIPYLLHWKNEWAKFCKSKGKWFESNHLDWSELEEELCGGSGPELDHDETLELMKRLVELPIIGTAEDSSKKQQVYDDLIDMDHASVEKCHDSVYRKFNDLADDIYNSNCTQNLLPFLNTAKDRQDTLCEIVNKN